MAKDYLGLHLRDLPYFRSLVRAVEARFYTGLPLEPPTLDLGCGDGHFATVAFERMLEVGLDPWEAPLREAAQRSGYQSVVQSAGATMPFPDGWFHSAVSNSVLEHIPEVEGVLKETARVLKPGAAFLFCVPNHQFLSSLSFGRLLDKVKLGWLADVYRRFFNRISRHYHCDPPEVWERRLEAAGFELERWWHYFPPESQTVVEWGHYLGLPCLLAKKISGRWILVPQEWNLWLTRRMVEWVYERDPISDEGVYTFYVARKKR